ncbi:MAG: non-hydrolyzing UDP-N-acetylglucosamine 2-epimerase [Bacteroidota bacterium]
MHLVIIVGTRPNFIKVTRFKKAASIHFPEIKISIVHTGQHSDASMARIFFEQFGLFPDHEIHLGAETVTGQMAEIIVQLEKVLLAVQPDKVMVVGDVNSTLAGAIAAAKLGISVVHLESGLRSFDRSMPEEINRIITDRIADEFFITEKSGKENLLNEGVDPRHIHFTGNTMIDSMVEYSSQIKQSSVTGQLDVKENEFILMTMHRPATVDRKEGLLQLAELLNELIGFYPVVFPVHPRTKKNISQFGLEKEFFSHKKIIFTSPLSYFDFQKLVSDCRFVLTDSGGIQEETTWLKKPCLTLRKNTERPVTVTQGTNTLVPFQTGIILEYVRQIENNTYKKGEIPENWDGKSTERVLEIISRL